MPDLEEKATAQLNNRELASLRRLVFKSFGDDFTVTDWAHALGGAHFYVTMGARAVSHAAVVERTLVVGETAVVTGYVEAVATDPHFRGQGLGSAVMEAIGGLIDRRYQMGALSTGSQGFYERLGWLRWEGPTFVRRGGFWVRTTEDDGSVMVLPTSKSPVVDLEDPISCDDRPGDAW